MSRVLLVNPPQSIYDGGISFGTYVPIGILSVAAGVRSLAQVRVLDCLLEGAAAAPGDGCTVYGTPPGRIAGILREFDPAVVGVATPFSAQADHAIRLGRLCREVVPGALVVFGGPHASVRPASLLEAVPGSCCVAGEGEESFPRLVAAGGPGPGIPGLAWMEHGALRRTPQAPIADLDRLPFPAYDLVDLGAYLRHELLYRNRSALGPSLTVITSRGCPFACVFCSIQAHMGRRFRAHSPEYVLRHLEHLAGAFGIRACHFEDDNISLDPDRFERILDLLVERGLGLAWDLPNGIRADTLSPLLLRKMKAAGCRRLVLAVESGSQRVLNEVIGKAMSLDRAVEAAKECARLGLETAAFYVIGFPGETLPEMRQTLRLAARLRRRWGVAPILLAAAPLYGTRLHELCQERGYLKPGLADRDFALAAQAGGRALISTEEFASADVDRLTRRFLARMGAPCRPFAALGRLLSPITAGRRGRRRC